MSLVICWRKRILHEEVSKGSRVTIMRFIPMIFSKNVSERNGSFRKYSMLWKSRQLKYAICRVFREIKRTL